MATSREGAARDSSRREFSDKQSNGQRSPERRRKRGDDAGGGSQAAVSAIFAALAGKAEAIDPTLKNSVGAEQQKALAALANLEAGARERAWMISTPSCRQILLNRITFARIPNGFFVAAGKGSQIPPFA